MDFRVGDHVAVREHERNGCAYRNYDGVIVNFTEPDIAVVQYTPRRGLAHEVEFKYLTLIQRLTLEEVLTHACAAVRYAARYYGEQYIPLEQFIERMPVV